jgi:hypothetical protein
MATSAGATRAADQIAFAHNSERQFARLLDFYQVEWEYEPTAFPIEWDAAGQPVQHFRPDFYLPRFGLYIEITTLNQRLVTKKNRKVRRLRELYPDIRIRVLYQRDYLSLLAKYGLEPPSQMLDQAAGTSAPEPRTRTPGQIAPGSAAAPGSRGSVAHPGASGEVGSGGAGLGEVGLGEAGLGEARRGEAGLGAAGSVEAGAGPRPPAGRAAGVGEAGIGEAGSGGAGSGVDGTGDAGSAPAGGGVVGAIARAPGRGRGAVERARAAGRPRALPDPPQPAPPLPADPELVRLAQVLLPAEEAARRGPATAERAG